MTDPARPPRRVRVTRSTPYGARAPRAAGPRRDLPGDGREGADLEGSVDDVFDADLRRTLLRWSAGTLAVVGVPLFGLPVVLVAVPGLASAEVAGVPLPWLLLGVAVYPLTWLAGRWFVTGAERTEREYAEELGERRQAGSGPEGPTPPGSS